MRKTFIAIVMAALAAGCSSTRTTDTATQDAPAVEPPTVQTTATTPEPTPVAATPAAPAVTPMPDNALLRDWTGRYSGVPPFDQVRVAEFRPAIEWGISDALAAIDRIANDPAPATFENTIAAMEGASRPLDRALTVYSIWSSNMSSPEFQPVEREMEPRLAAYFDQITQNEKLFRRIEQVYNSPAKARLTPEQQRLTWLTYTNFVRGGARLDDNAKKRLSDINQQLADLYTRFSQNVLSDETEHFLVIDSERDLAGLPQSLRDSAAAAATARNMTGKWVINNTRSAVDPFLTYSDRRDLREKAWRMFIMRGDNGDEHDNNAIITQILKFRAERANLLGYPTHAHWRLENAMAKNPERAMELMEAVWTPAVARVKQEVTDMQKVANREGAKITIEPWDYRYYAEKVRKQRYDLDQNEVKQYLQLDKLVQAMHWAAGELYNYQFQPVSGVAVYHPDVTVYEVTDRATGKHVGLWYFDPFARPGKRSGAWMNAYRNQERYEHDITTIVSNNANFVKGKPGEPVLISWDDAETMFHEFGHALHGLRSNVTYPSVSGTAVARDYVEFPSQLNEHWLSTPEVLNKFAVHYKTGKPIPQSLVKRIEKAATFNEGFATTEYLSSALVDMKMHLAGNQTIDPDRFEKETLAELGMPKEIVMRHRPPQFLHVFSGDGYSAGYYSYLWSDVLTADAAEAFRESGSFYDRATAERLGQLLSVGNTIDPADAYRTFRGRDPKIDALMRKRGFPVPMTSASQEQQESTAPRKRLTKQ